MIRKKNIDNALLKNTTGTIDDDNVDIDFKIEVPAKNDGRSEDDVIYVNYVPPSPPPPPPPPPPPVNPSPLVHPRERLRQRTKEIREQKEKDRREAKTREQKERYRRKVKKKAINILNNRSKKKQN